MTRRTFIATTTAVAVAPATATLEGDDTMVIRIDSPGGEFPDIAAQCAQVAAIYGVPPYLTFTADLLRDRRSHIEELYLQSFE